jgi:hypothetical protein
MNHIIRLVIGIELHLNSLNRKDSFSVSKLWNPHIHFLKEQKQAVAKDMAYSLARPSSSRGSYKVFPESCSL